MAKQDFGNGLMYDPETGEVVINDATGNQVYQFDPTKNQTNYNGQTFSGRYNPLILGQMTGEQVNAGYDPLIKNQQQYTNNDPTNNRNAAKYWNNLGQTQADQIAFNSAYGVASKGASAEDSSFFDTLKSMADQRNPKPGTGPSAKQTTGEYAGSKDVSAIMDNPNLSDAVKQAILGNLTNKPELQGTQTQIVDSINKLAAKRPDAAPMTQQAPTQAPVQSSQPTDQKQPDYTGFFQAVYNQVAPSFTNAPAQPTTSFQIGAPKAPVMATNKAAPDFHLGGYNPQPGYSTPSSGMSGKGAVQTPDSQQSQGMATGQFGSK